MKSKFVLACLVVLGLVGVGYAITVNPASSVTAASAATGLTIPYRDANGDFAMGALTASGAAISGTTSLTGKFVPFARTKAQFNAITPAAAGEVYFCSDCTAKNLCVSTGTTLSGFLRVDSTTIGCGTNE